MVCSATATIPLKKGNNNQIVVKIQNNGRQRSQPPLDVEVTAVEQVLPMDGNHTTVSLSLSVDIVGCDHTHTHTHTHFFVEDVHIIYIYISVCVLCVCVCVNALFH